MSINLQHVFPSLLEGTSKPVLILGSGASYGHAPNLNDLFTKKCQDAEEKLDCCSGINFSAPTADDNLYSWAESIIEELEKNGIAVPKLRIAEKLDLLSDMRWQPQISYRALQNLARHRVIARFVREKRWQAIWSLNWDTYLETALESIGINSVIDATLNDFPWTSKYKTFVTEEDYDVPDSVFKLHKPHGCVRSLIYARKALNEGNPDGIAERLSERFLITKSEMASLAKRTTNQDHNFYANIREAFSGRSLYTLGWKADAEGYLLKTLESVGTQLRTQNDDSLCVINRSYYETGGHGRLATIYGKTKEQVYIEVEKGFSTDDLLLWLQAKYAVAQLLKWAKNAKKAEIQLIINNLNTPNPAMQRLIYDWADCLLPAWIRFCWRAGLINYHHNGQLISPHDIRMESPDEHIPLSLGGAERVDIESSIPLLLSLIGEDASLDLRKYPGGIYREKDRTLIVPLPGWTTECNDLAGLKPLIDEVKQNRGFGYVERIAVLPVGYDSAPVIDNVHYMLSKKLSTVLNTLAFAKEGAIAVISLDEVSGGGHA